MTHSIFSITCKFSYVNKIIHFCFIRYCFPWYKKSIDLCSSLFMRTNLSSGELYSTPKTEVKWIPAGEFEVCFYFFLIDKMSSFSSGVFTWQSKYLEKSNSNCARFFSAQWIWSFYYGWHWISPASIPTFLERRALSIVLVFLSLLYIHIECSALLLTIRWDPERVFESVFCFPKTQNLGRLKRGRFTPSDYNEYNMIEVSLLKFKRFNISSCLHYFFNWIAFVR